VPALLWAWYPGQDGGQALAEAIFGKVNPSGRLPVSFARKYADHPAASYYSTRLPLAQEAERTGPLLEACATLPSPVVAARYPKSEGPLYQSPYCEDVFVGYRGFDRAQVAPLFPFGFGLSYTKYEYSDLQLVSGDGGALAARVTVKNVGAAFGREVVQIYAAPPVTVDRPPQQLAGYASVELAPGEARALLIPLSLRAFALYQTGSKPGWVLPGGRYEVRASSSSRDHRLATMVTLPGGVID
jgi:beta-glucosidase